MTTVGEAREALLDREAYNARSFTLITPDLVDTLIAAIRAEGLDVEQDSCPCGHDDNSHVHYCSADTERGSCGCAAEYARLAKDAER